MCVLLLGVKAKGKTPCRHEWSRALRSFLTWAVDGSEWLAPRSGHFTPRKETRYLLFRSLSGPPGPVWAGLEPRTAQPVAVPAAMLRNVQNFQCSVYSCMLCSCS